MNDEQNGFPPMSSPNAINVASPPMTTRTASMSVATCCSFNVQPARRRTRAHAEQPAVTSSICPRRNKRSCDGGIKRSTAFSIKPDCGIGCMKTTTSRGALGSLGFRDGKELITSLLAQLLETEEWSLPMSNLSGRGEKLLCLYFKYF